MPNEAPSVAAPALTGSRASAASFSPALGHSPRAFSRAGGGAAKARGFTLVELVLTLVVLGILSIVVLPRFFDATAFRARGYFDDTLSAARYGNKLALASGCPVRLDVSGAGYALQQRASCLTGSFTLAVKHPARGGTFAAAPPAGVTLSGAAIEFQPSGSSTGGSVTVNTRSFAVVAATGYVRQN